MVSGSGFQQMMRGPIGQGRLLVNFLGISQNALNLAILTFCEILQIYAEFSAKRETLYKRCNSFGLFEVIYSKSALFGKNP